MEEGFKKRAQAFASRFEVFLSTRFGRGRLGGGGEARFGEMPDTFLQDVVR